VGAWGQTVKIAPPLTVPRDALEEALGVLAEATDEAVAFLARPPAVEPALAGAAS
jgi:acetylornithine/succinyldiaminopimelate/putrescine aminotransferase